MPNRMNPMQMLQMIQQNPAQVLGRAGLNIPTDLTNPNDIIQYLMNSGQVSQERYNQARQIVARFKK